MSQGRDVGTSWIRSHGRPLFCYPNRAGCCARMGSSERSHGDQRRISNGWHFDGVVGTARGHLRFTPGSGICRALDFGFGVDVRVMQIRKTFTATVWRICLSLDL